MIRPALAIALMLALASSTATASEVVVDGRAFRVPEGFIVERVAGPPLVDRPIVADFDEQGRLYVADSSGSNDNVKKQEVERPHRIVRLEDSDGDGRFDRSVVFADRMMFPEGAMWLDGSLYVSAPPSIWKLTDTDHDGIADRREEWFQGKTLTGCANDLHGPYAGPDGRIYWCKGAFAPQTYERPGRKPLVTRAAHIFRAKADGTGIEPVMTGGMDNPVEVAFTAEGERIFTTTFLQQPGGGKRDGLIHALYGGVYGKVHDVIDGHPRTGPDVLPPLVHLGPAAPSGLMRAESDALGCRDNLFAACFNLRKVTRHELTPEGASFSAETDDFLASDDLDFHPTDVLEDADGSLLVIDTGGWYKICCPTSQLVKPDVLGGIYRVRRAGAPKVDDPRGLTLAWAMLTPDGLAGLLGDPRPTVRRRSIAELARRGDAALPAIDRAIREGGSTEARRDAAWAACRIDSPSARASIRAAIEAADVSARRVAIHSAGLWRDREAWPRLASALKDPSLAVRRGAAEALGRVDEAGAIPALVEAASADDVDWALRHSLAFALIEIGDHDPTQAALHGSKPAGQAVALIALDQMDGGSGLDAGWLINTEQDPALLRTIVWILGHRPDAGSPVSYFEDRLAKADRLSAPDLAELEGQLTSFDRNPGVKRLLGDLMAGEDRPRSVRLLALRVISHPGFKDAPELWLSPLMDVLDRGDEPLVRQSLAALRPLAWPKGGAPQLASVLRRIAAEERYPADIRLGALAILPVDPKPIRPETFDYLLDQLSPGRPVASRTAAADLFARLVLSPDQYSRLAEAVAGAGPLELPRLLDAFDRAGGEAIGLKLVDALARSPARSTLREETLQPHLARFGPAVARPSKELYRAIERDSADRREDLEKLLANLSGGDIRRGQAVFNGQKAACVTCHAIGYVGGKLGPDLSKIGQVRAGRDLLESIVYPSASFVRSYEPVSVAMKDGKVVSGLLRKDAPDEVVVAVAADREEQIARDQVEEMAPGTVSVMPAGLDRQLTPAELADLIAFLKACR